MTRAQVIAAMLAEHTSGAAVAGCGPCPGRGPTSGSGATCGSGPGVGGGSGVGGGPGTGSGGSGSGSGTEPDAGSTAGPRDERRGIEIRVGLAALLGRDEHPAEIPGLGLLVAPAARHRVAVQRRAQWRFAVTDSDGHLLSEGITRRRPRSARGTSGPAGGIVELHVPASLLAELFAGVEVCGEWAGVVADIARRHGHRDRHLRDLDARPHDRLPSAALRRHTEIRDRTCTHPGCRHRAHRSQQDHTRDHTHGGATVRANSGPACPHDHRVKHDAGWLVEQPEPGTFVWRSPLGGTYVGRGEFLTPPMPEPFPTDTASDPDEEDTGRHDDGPILRRPLTGPPPRRGPPPVAGSSDGPEPF